MMPPHGGGGRGITAKTTYAPNGTEQMSMKGGGGSPFMDLYARWLRSKLQPQQPVRTGGGMGVNQVGGQEEAQDSALASANATRARWLAEQKAQGAKFAPIYGTVVPAGLDASLNGVQWMGSDAANPNARVTGYRQVG